jgi:hypothetical protein
MKRIIEAIKFGATVSVMLFGGTLFGIIVFCLFIYFSVKGLSFLGDILIKMPTTFQLPSVVALISVVLGIVAAIFHVTDGDDEQEVGSINVTTPRQTSDRLFPPRVLPPVYKPVRPFNPDVDKDIGEKA